MGSRDPVETYLAELAPLLSGSLRRRRRILAEVEDHLRGELDERAGDGEPESEAVAGVVSRFGDPRTVAAGFVEARARRRGERAGRLAVVAVLAFAALFGVSTQLQSVRADSPLSGAPADAVAWLAVQIALVATAIGVLRRIRLREVRRARAGALESTLRADAVAVGAAAISLGLDGLALAGASQSSSAIRALDVGVGLAAVAALAALVALVLAAAPVRRLRGLNESATDEATSALEHVLWACELARRRAEAWQGGEGWCRVRRVVVRSLGMLEGCVAWALCRRAQSAVLVAVIAGGALGGASLWEHGLPADARALLQTLAAFGVLFIIEACVVVACAYGFDRLLGLWPIPDRRRVPR